ncbi:type VII secretion protein EccB [Kitasatospora sp. NPDC050463]|uniref:type VII secretion protein EccB n=1 Tax=Kitasatospora sp. NPDC050463 TaxID=3155786 RepID=UPI0033F3AE87
MASRRDELNAYTFARKRTVGAFLLPNGAGSDEDAPRPVKAILPSVVVGALVVGGFGLWGVFKPSAPVGWDNGKNVVQGKKSTTRYVVLTDPDGKTKRLHQVLNMSSARLVLPVDAKVVVVADEVLDKYPNHGPTIGIPYAPDKLPTKENASKPMKWSVCESPGPDDKQETANQALFVAGGADAKTLAAKDRVLDVDQALLVKEIDEQKVAAQPGPGQPPIDQSKLNLYLVDAKGRKHGIGGTQTSESDKKQLMAAIFGASAKPQPVKKDWLETLVTGNVIEFPKIDGLVVDVKGPNSSVALQKAEDRKIGRLVRYGDRYFVVGKDQLFVVTQLQAELIRQNPAWQGLYNQDADKTPRIDELMPADYAAFNTSTPLKGVGDDWPTRTGAPANNWQAQKDAKSVICSTFDGIAEDGKTPLRSVWAGPAFPAKHSSGVGSAYVTPGYGLFYRALDAGAGGSGSDYLITETGLRYAVPANSTGGKGAQATPTAQPGKPGPSPTPTPTPTAQPGDPAAGQPQQPQQDEAGGNQARLGYQGLQPVPVPQQWSNLVPFGPALNAKTAAQQQNA